MRSRIYRAKTQLPACSEPANSCGGIKHMTQRAGWSCCVKEDQAKEAEMTVVEEG